MQCRQVVVEKRFYGYRRVQRELRQRGRWVNASRVLRLMREDNLLCLRTRRFVPPTTDSHGQLALEREGGQTCLKDS
jgi:putative transposase